MEENYIDRLRQILATGGLSHKDLARRLDVTSVALSRWLNGHAQPHRRRIESIQKLYKEIVGYPAITDQELSFYLKRADRLKRRGLWSRIRASEALQDELLLEHTYNSSAIEGSTFTKKETEAVIFDKAVLRDKSLIEHLEITNHAAVLRKILQRKYEGPVTEAFIQELHRGLMQGIRDDAGEYSKHQRVIRGVELALTHPKDIPEEMGLLIRRWKGKPVRKTVQEIARFHVDFELIHPFGDGNGRVGRLPVRVI